MVFKRQLSYYIVTIYVPTFMIVCVSWMSFWLDHKSAPARVALTGAGGGGGGGRGDRGVQLSPCQGGTHRCGGKGGGEGGSKQLWNRNYFYGFRVRFRSRLLKSYGSGPDFAKLLLWFRFRIATIKSTVFKKNVWKKYCLFTF
jgi:hypothetical protein